MHEVCPSITKGSAVAHPRTENDPSEGNTGASRTRRHPPHCGQAVWKSARRNGQRVLDMAPSLSKMDVRTCGWQEAEISKNDTLLLGHVKMAKGTEQAMLKP